VPSLISPEDEINVADKYNNFFSNHQGRASEIEDKFSEIGFNHQNSNQKATKKQPVYGEWDGDSGFDLASVRARGHHFPQGSINDLPAAKRDN
jgi:hypothetical protein